MAKRLHEQPRPAYAEPAPILSRRVVVPYAPPGKAETPADALAITLAERGGVDLPRIAGLLGITEDEAITQMHGKPETPLIFKDPETGKWETRNEYLSGQVKRKLAAAEQAGLEKNIQALRAIQPEPWGAENIQPLLGSTWVDPAVYADFIQHISGEQARVLFAPATNSFAVTGKETPASVEWGTERMGGVAMIAQKLNNRSIRITDTDSNGNEHLNEEETQLANLKADGIVREFADWVYLDGDRRTSLVDTFNEKFNTRVLRQHDGSHLVLPGKVPDAVIAMRRHQKNAIWRGISERFMLLDHVVGAGKTFTAIARAMERRRMGLSRKPMIVVPNHMVEQFTADTYRLYPGAKVLAAGKKDFEKARRRRIFGKIASGDWDIVIVPHSSFGFIGISQETEERYLEAELRIAEQAVKDAWEQSGEAAGGRRKPFNVKEAERLAEKIQTRMDKIKGSRRDNLLTFEQMGVDDLTVDEAHEFKNLFYSSNLSGVRGMGNKTGSQKAFDLYNKVRVLRESPTGTVTFMTGTPISNSAAEMFTMLRYLAAEELRDLGLEHFDAWRSQYVSTSSKLEPDETGRLKEVNRLGRSWSNMRSLMDLYYSFTDAVSNDDIKKWYAEDNAGKEFPIPRVKGGDRKAIVIQPTDAQVDILMNVVHGFGHLPFISDPFERNKERLRLMDRARKVALDARAADKNSTSDEAGGKLEKLAGEVHRIYKQWTPDRGTQLIFLDRSTPKAKGDDTVIKVYDALIAERDAALAAGDEEAFRRVGDRLESYNSSDIEVMRTAQAGGWNAYQQIKDNLIKLGVPANEIRFIHEANNDAQKQAMFDEVNAGTVRVLIGSTSRMGAGTNVQQRLVAIHHGDVTWKPSDIEQREGRGIRQGNKLLEKYGIDKFELEILTYPVERSIDAKMWDLNSEKLRTINGIRKYGGEFTMEFEDEESASMAEIAALASGDPLLMERVKLGSAIDKLELLERANRRKVWGFVSRIEQAEKSIVSLPARIERQKGLAAEAAENMEALLADVAARSVTVEGEKFSGEKAAFHAMGAAKAAVEAQQAGNDKARFSIMVDGEKRTSKQAYEDAIFSAIGDQNPFLMVLKGKRYVGRTDAAREIAARAQEAVENFSTANNTASKTLDLGVMNGFKLEADIDRNVWGSVTVTLSAIAKDGSTVSSRSVGQDGEKKIGTVQIVNPLGRLSLDLNPRDFTSAADSYERDLKRATEELPALREKAADSAFPRQSELDAKRARLEEVLRTLTGAPTPPAAPEAADDEDAGPDNFSIASAPTGNTAPALRAALETEFGADTIKALEDAGLLYVANMPAPNMAFPYRSQIFRVL